MVEVSFTAGEMGILRGGVMEVSSSKKKGSGDSGKDTKEAGLLLKAAEMLDLPGEVVAGVARIEITGGREIIIENHGGILEYGPNEIDVNSDGVILRIQGDGLEIRAMTATELSIRGMVLSLEFVY
jgi:sporulation protein YqfC